MSEVAPVPFLDSHASHWLLVKSDFSPSFSPVALIIYLFIYFSVLNLLARKFEEK